MRHLLVLTTFLIAAISSAQSSHFNFTNAKVRFMTAFQSYAPNSQTSGITIIRSQKDWDKYWAALHGRAQFKNMVALTKYDFKNEQLIAIVLPPRINFNAIPQVENITTTNHGIWRIDVSPKRGTGFQNANKWQPYVIIRTPRGTDNLDIVLHGDHGNLVLSTRERPKLGWKQHQMEK